VIALRSRVSATDDAGAFAILYALVLVLVIGLAAIVVDLSSLRSDRRLDRAAADSAAIAATTILGDPPDARAACLAAWHYTLQDLDVSAPDTAINCASTFLVVGDAGYVSCPSSALTATGTIAIDSADVYTIKVIWPVPDNSPLMTYPDLESASTPVTQALDPGDNGDGISCQRVAVTITRTRPLVLSGIFGTTKSSTYSHSVARSNTSAGGAGVAAPLAVLDPHACNALVAAGGAAVLIAPNDSKIPGVPGMIVVDSDGQGSDCSNNDVTIKSNAIAGGHDCTPATFTTSQCNSAIWAEDSATGGTARIYSVALRYGIAHSYNPSQVTCTSSNPPSGPLCPRPVLLRTPITRWDFIDTNYNCAVRTDCLTSDPKNGIGQLKSFLGNGNFTSSGNCLSDTFPSGFLCVSDTEVGSPSAGFNPSTHLCSSSAPTSYAGNVYVDCPANNGGFTAQASTSFPGPGTVVFSGDVTIKSCLMFGVTDATTYCPYTGTPPVLPNDGPVVYVAGTLTTSGNSSTLSAPQTFIMIGNCSSDGTSCTKAPSVLTVQSGSAGGLLWTAPLGTSTCSPGSTLSAPSVGCFAKLALWGEYATPSSSPDSLSGQAHLVLQGSFFTPNAQFTLSGGPDADIKSAQFVSGKLNVTGGALLTMVPDADHTNELPLSTGVLIR
jgi:hypothetical protein